MTSAFSNLTLRAKLEIFRIWMTDTTHSSAFLRSYGRYVVAGAGIGAVGGLAYLLYRKNQKSGQTIVEPDEPSIQSATRKKDEGNAYFKKKDYAAALKSFQEGIELCPEDANELRSNLFQNIAVILEYDKDFQGCVENCTKAILLNPRYLKAIKRRAQAYSKIQRYRDALIDNQIAHILQNSQQLEPSESIESSVQILATKKKDEFLQKHKDDLIPISQDVILEWLSSSLIHDPFLKKMNELIHAQSPYENALVALKEDRYNDILSLALDEFSAEDSPFRMESALLASRFYFFHNQIEKGQEMLQQFKQFYEVLDEEIRKNYSELFVAYQILRMIYAEEKTPTRKKIAEECLAVEPRNSDPLFVLGLCSFGDEDLNGSIEAFSRIKEIEPEHPYFMYHLLYAKFIDALKRSDMAQAHQCVVKFEETLAQRDAPAYAHFFACRIYHQMQNIELSLEELDKALAIKPDYVDAIYLKTLLNIDPMTVQSEEGMKKFMVDVEDAMYKLIALEPNFAEPYKMLAKIYIDKREFKKAFEYYEKSMKLCRKPQELLMLSAEYVMAEARSEAIEYLEEHPA